MPHTLDPEIAAAFADHADELDAVVVGRGDWQALRAAINPSFERLMRLSPDLPDVLTRDFAVTAKDGATIAMRWYAKKADSSGPAPGSAVVYAHGGGMILGSMDLYDCVAAGYVNDTGVPILSVDYRLAPEATGETLAEDVFAGLRWLVDHAADLAVDPARIALMGDSAGGGVAAGAAILARDRGVALAKQILIYPMLDDRNLAPDRWIAPLATWSDDHNFTGWNALLGAAAGGEGVSPIAAPARLTDLAGLAPAYIEVGDLDIFRNEDIAYAQRLALAGVPIELHVHPGAPHGFERFAPDSAIGQRVMADRLRVLRAI